MADLKRSRGKLISGGAVIPMGERAMQWYFLEGQWYPKIAGGKEKGQEEGGGGDAENIGEWITWPILFRQQPKKRGGGQIFGEGTKFAKEIWPGEPNLRAKFPGTLEYYEYSAKNFYMSDDNFKLCAWQ